MGTRCDRKHETEFNFQVLMSSSDMLNHDFRIYVKERTDMPILN